LILGFWQNKTLALLAKAYGSIPPEKAAEYLGLPTDQIIPGTSTLPNVLCSVANVLQHYYR